MTQLSPNAAESRIAVTGAQPSILLEKRSNGVAVITLNRPHVLNALDVPSKERLGAIWQEIADDGAVHVAVITGAGSKAFCAGSDIEEINRTGRMVTTETLMRAIPGEIALVVGKPVSTLGGAVGPQVRAPEEQRRASAAGYTQQFGISGLLEQDDVVLWERVQRAREGAIGGEQYVDYSCARVPDLRPGDRDRGDWLGPGTVWHAGTGPGAVADDAMWHFIRRWYDMMIEA